MCMASKRIPNRKSDPEIKRQTDRKKCRLGPRERDTDRQIERKTDNPNPRVPLDLMMCLSDGRSVTDA